MPGIQNPRVHLDMCGGPVDDTMAVRMGRFVEGTTLDDLSESVRDQLKMRILDSLGCAIGALDGEPVKAIRAHVQDFTSQGRCTLIGGGRSSPPLAAFYNGALVRYLDFSDSYLAAGETCHPSDNLAPVLAATEYAGGAGGDVLTALAVAYQVQCRLSEEAPVRIHGFDHATQGAYAVASGVSRALGLDARRCAHAIAIAGAGSNPLRVTRTGSLSNWKGLAYPYAALAATHATFLAMRGITGPLEVFEGNKGFMDTITGPFDIDWEEEGLDGVLGTILKKYNSEVHAQSAVEAALRMRREADLDPSTIESILVETFDVAYQIIGGGEEGDHRVVNTKEAADHSLPYVVSVAFLDGEVTPRQYTLERIARRDVQDLLRRVTIRPREDFSARFPGALPTRLEVHLTDGRTLEKETEDYEGFHTRPMSWEVLTRKFHTLVEPFVVRAVEQEIVEIVRDLEARPASELARVLGEVGSR